MTKARDRLTALMVRSLNEPGLYHDGAGLYLQVARGGSKSWIYRYTLHKRTRDMGLGSAGTFTLAEARARAQKHRQLLADGIDPIFHRQNEIAAIAAEQAKVERLAHRFDECAHQYHRQNASDWKNAKHADQWINTLTTYAFPHFGSKPVGDIGIDDIRAALMPIWTAKAETASRVLQRVRTVINYATAMGYCDGIDSERWEQLKHTLPKNKRQREVEHHASCPHAQTGALLRQVAHGPCTPAVRLAFAFIVLRAARSGEVRGATWEEIDTQRRLWVIPKQRMKAGREHAVPLSDAAWDLLEQAKALQSNPDHPAGLIFPNPKGKPFSDMTFTQLLRRMQQPYTMHGFRASFRTWGAETGHYEHEMLEIALSHIVGDATVRAYQRSDVVEKRRELMQEWADYLGLSASFTPPVQS